jgi:hypothetical protein
MGVFVIGLLRSELRVPRGQERRFCPGERLLAYTFFVQSTVRTKVLKVIDCGVTELVLPADVFDQDRNQLLRIPIAHGIPRYR